MSILDKAMDKAEQLIGEAKEKIGQLTGNEKLESTGTRDKFAGEVKETAHGLRDKAAGAIDDAQDKLSDDKE